MKEVFPYPSEEAEEVSRINSFYKIELASREEDREEEKKDPYEFMNPCDKWMINKQADKACWDYVFNFIEDREINLKAAPFISLAFISATSNPILAAVFSILFFLKYWFLKFKKK